MNGNGLGVVSTPGIGPIARLASTPKLGRRANPVPGPAPRNFGLDLIRASAIGLVLASHYGGIVTWYLSGTVPLGIFLPGYFGVELFFVLSGFLIGGLLLSIVDEGMSAEAWWLFMARRLMRTLPAYFAWMAVAFVVHPHPQMTLWETLSYVFLVQNFAWPMLNDYWYSVTWSLTIEEWFYLLFSLSVLGLSVLKGRAPIVVAAVCFIAVPTVIRLCIPSDLAWDAYIRKVVFTRLDAIAFGVALAVLSRNVNLGPRARLAAFMCGGGLLCAIVLYWLVIVGQWDIRTPVLRTMIFSLTSVGFAAVFPLVIGWTCVGGWLRWSVTRVSKLSYSLYLVHLTVLRALWPWIEPRGLLSLIVGILGLIASFVLAWILHAAIEAPIMALRPAQFPYRSRLETARRELDDPTPCLPSPADSAARVVTADPP